VQAVRHERIGFVADQAVLCGRDSRFYEKPVAVSTRRIFARARA
jgi:hypothetical protein